MSESAADTQRELQIQEKSEVSSRDEKTTQGRYYIPLTDIYETPDALVVVMKVPGVDKEDVNVQLDQDCIKIDASISLDSYSNMTALYTEYGVGHYSRSFGLSNAIDKNGIEAKINDGVLVLTLPKMEEVVPRSIQIQ